MSAFCSVQGFVWLALYVATDNDATLVCSTVMFAAGFVIRAVEKKRGHRE